jgi:periplasmic divalent cation tolerance protein
LHCIPALPQHIAPGISFPKIAMKSASHCSVVLVTAPNLKTARALARAVLKAKVAACANLVPKIESHYWWQDRLESSAEVLIILKTPRRHLPALEKLVLKLHPYDTPELLAIPLLAGNKKYLDWLSESCC